MVTCSHCKRVRSRKRMKPGKNNAWLCFDHVECVECEEMKKEQRFFIDSDPTDDYYCIPVEQKDAWEKWTEGDLWDKDLPDGCFYVGGWSNRITFTDPKLVQKVTEIIHGSREPKKC